MFAQNMTEMLLAYASATASSTHDCRYVRAVVKERCAPTISFSSLVLGIAKSPPFQQRTAIASRRSAR